jgi:hypothetical protein
MRSIAMSLVGVVALALPVAAQTTSLPRAVTAACDGAHRAVEKTPGMNERRRTGSFGDETLRAPIASCRIDISGSMKRLGNADLPTAALSEYFWAQKWTELIEFSADGPDGTSFAYRGNDGAACLVRGLLDVDAYTVTVLCGNAADFVRKQ